MPRRTPLVTVSAVVTPSIAEEIERLAKVYKVTKSHMVRQLLEEKLTERANQRLEEAHDRLEERLAKIENRLAGLIVKGVRASARTLYLTQVGLQYGHQKQNQEQLNAHYQESKSFAGQWLESEEKKRQRDA